MHNRFVVLASVILFPVCSAGQVINDQVKETLISNTVEQIVLFPQEKIHIQTDKPVYIAGETVWFRAHVAEAVLHTPVTSQYVYAELINQLDSVVERVKVRADSGAFSGHIELDQALPEGDYTLRAYTENMLNPGADYYFRKHLRVEGPFSATVITKVIFRSEKGDRMTAEVSFEDIRSLKKIVPDRLGMRINKQPLTEVSTDDDTISRYTFRLAGESDRRVLTIQTAKSTEYIQVPYPQNDYEVYFFPEGGNLPAGARSAVAFKALTADGMPANVTGHIIDSAGNIYARLETMHDGMGKFYMAAEEATGYYALCTDEQGLEKRFELPGASRNTYSLKTETVGDSVFISVLRSADIYADRDLFLLLHTRGIIHYAEWWDGNYSKVSFDRRDFPSGILQAILLDGKMNPLSERLVFCLNDDQAKAEFKTDRQNYEKRQPVFADVTVTGPDGLPRGGNFSVSVTDDNDIIQDSSLNILTSLLLTSDLKGHINNPSFYFLKNNSLANYALDLLMMTNGWRRYNIPEVMAGEFQKLRFTPKLGMEITGMVRTLITGKPVENAEVAAFSWGSGYFDVTVTDSTGRFAFRAIEFQDSTEFILQALNKKGKPGVELVIDNDLFPPVAGLSVAPDSGIAAMADEVQVSSYITKADTKYTMDYGMRTIDIEEVVITAKAPEKKKYSFSYYMPKVNQSSSNILDYEQIEELHPTFTSELIYHIPFTRVEGGKVIIERMKYSLNGTLYAVLIIDDMILNEYNIDDIDPYSIERIAVLKGAQAVMLGGAGAGGAIVITTRKGADIYKEVPKFNIRTVTPLGYQSPAEFYSPRYDTQEKRESGPADLRTTIFWNPNVAVPANGEAAFEFHTADTPSEYTVLIEGITSDGLIIHTRNRISRRNVNH
jgi:hypothetical protein